MYFKVRSVCALRMVSRDSLTSQAREVWIKPHFTIRDMCFFSDLGSRIISLIAGAGGAGISTSATSMTVGGGATVSIADTGAGNSTPATSMTVGALSSD